MNIQKNEKYKLIIFFTTIIFFPYLFLYMDMQRDILSGQAMAIVISFSPALGVSLGKYFFDRKKIKIHDKIVGVYAFLTSLLVLIAYVNIIDKDILGGLLDFMIFILGVWLLFNAGINNSNSELYFFKNKKKSMELAIQFFIIYLIVVSIASKFNIIIISQYVVTPLFIITIVLSIFGEEYGWRGYLQGVLQNKLGKRFGVVLLAIIWELWHIPVEIIWQKDLLIMDIYTHIVRLLFEISIAIAMGYVYMKTKNIWSVVFIHAINNGAFSLLMDPTKKFVWTIETIVNNQNIRLLTIIIVILIIVFSLYIFKKEYNAESV